MTPLSSVYKELPRSWLKYKSSVRWMTDGTFRGERKRVNQFAAITTAPTKTMKAITTQSITMPLLSAACPVP